ncbi:low molecular weight phosphotyrosine protein phosphatase [Oceanobacillus piezotolerans]|uniref:protein-tyrosine-phosphatase n=1 Tax=Oceanobacillus piezotolerans TaxID=2448030 RepID=A0A498D5X0_9BACI|nr:low molecular weight protein-tyrosine-phosphatase [Oceanobacillus piezotolerans]RLL40366.1 low molecular weight phosphotyrosine protein phosphatase [Oceanobacillus piezotolerans]
MIHVLFVCLGNICRSPMAEAVFREFVKKENLSDKIKVDSSGLGDWHIGKGPHRGTREVLDREKITYEGIVARQISEKDWSSFDYIIAMDDQNIEGLKKFSKPIDGIVVRKLMDFIEEPRESNVPDPYYTGDFDYTYSLVTEGCKELLNYIKKQHSLT